MKWEIVCSAPGGKYAKGNGGKPALAKHHGFTDEELDFIINYDIKYRMCWEVNRREEEE